MIRSVRKTVKFITFWLTVARKIYAGLQDPLFFQKRFYVPRREREGTLKPDIRENLTVVYLFVHIEMTLYQEHLLYGMQGL